MGVNHKILTNVILFFCLFTITGILLIDKARALASIGMIGIALSAIFYAIAIKKIKFEQLRIYVGLVCCFLILLPSYFYSTNLHYFFERLQINLPFLILPICWSILPKLNIKQIYSCFAWYILGVFFIASQSIIYYFNNQELVNELYLHSQVMPTLVSHHPTYSLMAAFASFLSWHLYSQKVSFYSIRFEKWIWVFVGVFLFVFTHVFSVRIGIVTLYTLLFAESIRYGISTSKLKAMFVFVLMLIFGALVLYNSPTFKNKIINTSKDLAVISSNSSANNQSLASRLISYKNAFEICNQSSWLFGCGLGDIEDLNNQIFKISFPDVSKPIIPHNQFLYLLAATGIVGVLGFSIAFLFPLWLLRNQLNAVLISIYILLLLAFQVEPVLQTQLGVAFSVFFLLMGIMLSLIPHQTEDDLTKK
jgi:O-antigen ligase